MLIRIRKIPEEEDFLLEVEKYYTGLTILKKIEFIYKLSSDQYVLTYESVRFKHADSISDFDIEEGDIMKLINIHSMPLESFVINCKTLTGQTEKINVIPTFTIETLRNIIFGVTGIPPGVLRLIFEGKQLGDQQTISSYGLKKNSVVSMVLEHRGS